MKLFETSFNTFFDKMKNGTLNEGIRNKDFSNAVTLMAQFLSKKLGKTFYPYPFSETYKKQTGESGIGVRYFADDMSCLRFNFENTFGVSNEITAIDYWTGQGSKISPDYTIDAHGDSLAKLLPKVANAILNPKGFMNESTIYERYNASMDSEILSLGAQNKSVAEIAETLDVSHKIVRRVLQGSGLVNIRKASTEKVNDSSELVAAIEKSKMTLEDKVEYLNTLLEDLADVTKAVGLKNINGLMISGRAGTGKTYTVTDTLEKLGVQYHMVAGSASTFGVLKELYYNNNSIVVFDDCDSALDDQETRNIFKAALDTKKVRTVSYMKANKQLYDATKEYSIEQIESFEQQGKIPNKFEFYGGIIFISNLDKKKLDPDGAIRSRSLIIDINPDDATLMERMKRMLEFIEPLDMPLDEKLEIFEFVKSTKNVSMRTFVKAAGFKMAGIGNWKRVCERYI